MALLLRLLTVSLLSLLIVQAQAAEPVAGDACSNSDRATYTSAGMLACSGSVWRTIQEYHPSGQSLVQIDYDNQACTAQKTGRLRYSSSLSSIWQYCNGTSWQAFTQPLCQEDDNEECYLNATRSASDLDFIASNIKDTINILGVTGSMDGDYGPTGGTSYTALTGTGVATGQSTACAILHDQTAWCWGYGLEGQLGDGNNTSSATRLQVNTFSVSGTGWVKIDAGFAHVCGIRNDGTAWCWGYGLEGQLGNSATAHAATPVQVNTAGVSGTAWTEIATGAYHTCGVRDNNTAWCWGYGGRGQLGHGASPSAQSTPVAVSSGSLTGASWVSLDGGWRHTCGVRDNGSIWCWGWGFSGILGDENGADHSSNVPVVTIGTGVTGTAWIDVSSSDDAHNCGIRDNGTAWCWGYGSWGRMGNGSTSSAIAPVQVSTTGVSGTAWTQISAGSRHTCAMRNDNTIWCWGYGSSGQLGNQSPKDTQTTPVMVNETGITGTDWTYIDAGSYYNCALRDDDSIWCWGDPGNGVLGRPTLSVPVIIPE